MFHKHEEKPEKKPEAPKLTPLDGKLVAKWLGMLTEAHKFTLRDGGNSRFATDRLTAVKTEMAHYAEK
jgi:hypothetical protein